MRMSVLRRTLLYVILTLTSLAMLTPFYWMISASLKPEPDIFSTPTKWIPSPFTLEHYRRVLTDIPFERYFINSVAIAIFVTLAHIFFDTLAAYAFAKLKFPGRDKLFFLLLMGLMVPFQVNIIPVFRIIDRFGLLDTYAALVLPQLTGVFGIFLMRQFISSIPDEIIDSARIDGCGELRVFFQIVMPLAAPGMATLAIFTFMSSWNDFLWPRLVINSEDHFTLPLGLAQLQSRNSSDWGTTMAGATLTALPLIIVFLFMQRRFIEGMTEGAVKE